MSAEDIEVASGQRIELRVPEEAAGTRLDRFLAESLGSRSRAQSLIEAERCGVAPLQLATLNESAGRARL